MIALNLVLQAIMIVISTTMIVFMTRSARACERTIEAAVTVAGRAHDLKEELVTARTDQMLYDASAALLDQPVHCYGCDGECDQADPEVSKRQPDPCVATYVDGTWTPCGCTSCRR